MRTLALSVLSGLLAACEMVPSRPPPYEAPRPLLVAAVPASDGAIYQTGREPTLFEDLKPRQVGDLLTVVLVEATDAQKSATTSTAKDSSIDIDNPTILGRPLTHHGTALLNTSLSASRDFQGNGASSQSNKLSGSVTVSVTERLANGNLVVHGEKQLTLNQGEEYVRLSGIVRPADIAPDNSVLSSRIADARITYSGSGALADSNSQGWLSRFFNSPWWPF